MVKTSRSFRGHPAYAVWDVRGILSHLLSSFETRMSSVIRFRSWVAHPNCMHRASEYCIALYLLRAQPWANNTTNSPVLYYYQRLVYHHHDALILLQRRRYRRAVLYPTIGCILHSVGHHLSFSCSPLSFFILYNKSHSTFTLHYFLPRNDSSSMWYREPYICWQRYYYYP